MKKKIFLVCCLTIVLVFTLLSATSAIAAEKKKIGALGRIKPHGGVIHIGIPPGNIISSVLVKRGDVVKKGTPLLISRESYPNEAEIVGAEMDLKEANTAGKKAIEIKKLESTIAKMELEHARSALKRMLEGGSDTYSAQAKEEREHAVSLAEAKFNLANKELERLKLNQEINTSRASAKVKAGKIKAQQSRVSAPIDGTILEISQNIGGSAEGDVVVKMADLSRMDVLADVFEGDVFKLSVGEKATITSKALSNSLTGRITAIGRIVSTKSRNVEIMIRLDNADAASRLINHEVNVSFDLPSAAGK
ncbi:MAG: efflux RND transporter periplasmic adaptor subunit [Smithella sp.]